MVSPYTVKPATAQTVNRLHNDRLGGAISSPGDSQKSNSTQAIRADLIGCDTCTAGDITAAGHAPVLALCRALLAAGLDPDQALEVFRGATLALRVHRIGEAAKLTVRESTKDGRPRFARLSGDGGPPMRKSGVVPTEGWTDWPPADEPEARRCPTHAEQSRP